MPREKLERIWGAAYGATCPNSDAALSTEFAHYGEVDVNALITLLADDTVVGHASLNLLHNSFSRRGWLLPAADLYKGNGRVKHEHFRIQVGPFL
ncbi:MAG: hypothetical protein KDA83_20565, partial [Planctomycetales bacterium]|nr:hypothetical protein [Planctomycetales bacterium]